MTEEEKDAYIKKLVQSNIDQQNKIAALSKKVYDLQKENAKVEELEKENAELKVSCKIQVDTAFQTIYEKDDQLAKAKDHIKKLLGCLQQDTNDPQTNYYVIKYMTEAEQFLDGESTTSNECHDCAKFDEMPKSLMCKTCDNGSHFQKKE